MDAEVKPRRRRKWPYLLLILLLGFAGYTWVVLHWAYSEGERVGVLQKLSRKGYLCKTSEGELAMYVVSGLAPQIWEFTVRDPDVARRLNDLLGERVRLHYTEHIGIPSSCFGDTRYYVENASQVGSTSPMATAPLPPAAPAPVQTP
jgi:hypothetical protein